MDEHMRRVVADVIVGIAAIGAGAAAWLDIIAHVAQFISVVGGAILVLWRGYEWAKPRLARRGVR